MSKYGSKTLCENFIRPITSEIPELKEFLQGRETIESLGFSDEYIKLVREYYDLLKSSISEEVIDAIINYTKTYGSVRESDYDRSDILVFIVVMSLLLADTEGTILNWYKGYSLKEATTDEVKSLASIIGYTWDEPKYQGVTISDNQQRRTVQFYQDLMRARGTEDAFKAAIKGFYYGEDVKLSKILIGVDFDQGTWTNGVAIESPYTTYEQQGTQVISPNQSTKNAYVKMLMDRLEQVRPAGIYLRQTYSEFVLSNFAGLTYWRHLYVKDNEDVVYPWETIKDTSVVKTSKGDSVLKVLTEGSMQPITKEYELLPISFLPVSNDYPLNDMQTIPFSKVRGLDFDTGTLNNSVYGDSEHKLYGTSWLYKSDASPRVVKDWIVSDVATARGRFYSISSTIWS